MCVHLFEILLAVPGTLLELWLTELEIVFESPVAPTAKRLQPNPTQLVATQLPVAVAEILTRATDKNCS
jgi:hypothetical protein